MVAKILVVDDEPPIREVVVAYLQKEGYDVFTAEDGPSGLRAARAFRPEVIVLDVMMPGMDGIELLSQLRRESNAYVIMLTAKADETDKIVGLSVGADDYVTKPFSPRELVARVKAALRRLSTGGSVREVSVLSSRHVRVDVGRREVWVDERAIELTSVEFDLLRTLLEYQGLVLSRQQLLEKVWGYDFYGEERVVDVHIGHIRRKLGDSSLIGTVRGIGYRFQDEPS